MTTMVSDQEIAEGVETVLRQSGPNDVTTLNGVVQQLEAKLGLDLSHKAGFIRDQINFLLRPYSHQNHPPPPPQQPLQQQKDHFAPQQPPNHPYHHPHPHHHQQHHLPQFSTSFLPQQFASHFTLNPNQSRPADVAPIYTFQAQAQPQQQKLRPPPPPPVVQHQKQHHPTQKIDFTQNAPTTAENPKESAPKKRGAGGLNKVCGVSPELQVVVGQPALPRTEIVKQLWAYIRKNNLQDPSNKRKIICDDALRVVFETDCTDMFKMNKLLSKHIITLGPKKEPPPPPPPPANAKRAKLDVESATDADTTVSTQSGSSNVQISEALAKFLGFEGREMLKSEAIRLVWEYIKVNNLEDPVNSMVIVCDPKLHELIGCESISALGIQEMLERYHFVK